MGRGDQHLCPFHRRNELVATVAVALGLAFHLLGAPRLTPRLLVAYRMQKLSWLNILGF